MEGGVEIHRHTLAFCVHGSEALLRDGIAGFGGLQRQARRPGTISGGEFLARLIVQTPPGQLLAVGHGGGRGTKWTCRFAARHNTQAVLEQRLRRGGSRDDEEDAYERYVFFHTRSSGQSIPRRSPPCSRRNQHAISGRASQPEIDPGSGRRKFNREFSILF